MTSLLVSFPRTISSKRMMLAGLKKWVSDNEFGPRGDAGDVVDAQCGSVARQNSSWLAGTIQILKHLFLERHALEDRLHHHIDVGEVVVAESGCDQGKPLVDELLREASALNRAGIVLSNLGEALVERGLIDLLEQNGNTGIGKNHGDPSAHGPRTDDGHTSNWLDGRVFRHIGNLCHLALPEKDVDERFGLIGEETFRKESPLHLATFFEGKFGCRFHRFNGGKWRFQTPLLVPDTLAGSRDDCRVLLGRTQFLDAFARSWYWFSSDFAGKGHRTGKQIAFDQAVDDTELEGFCCGNRFAVGTHFKRLGDAGKPRKALRSRRTGNEAELHFGLADLRIA